MAQIREKYIGNKQVSEGKLKTTNNPTNGWILGFDGTSGNLEWVAPTSADAHDVKVSLTDTTPSFLTNKLIVTSGKLTKKINNSGLNENIELSIGSDVFDKTADTTDNITEGSTNVFYTDGRVSAYITTIKGVANGLAPLNASGKIDSSYLPAIEFGDIKQFADIAERDLYTSAGKGDIALVVDASDDPEIESGGATYIYDGTDPYATTGWLRLQTPDSAVISVNGEVGEVSLGTDDIPEGIVNLYFTDARARAAISAGNGISYNSATGVISANVGYVETKKVETITITSTEIANKYFDLEQTPKTSSAVGFFPHGGIRQRYGSDFTVVSDGTNPKRVSWNGLGLETLLEVGDIIDIEYTY